MMSLFKRKKAGEEANTIPEAMDDITQTLLIPVKDEGEKTMCVDAYETSQAEIASYTSIGTRKSQQDSICFDFGDFCTVCAVCDGMGGLTGGERASFGGAWGNEIPAGTRSGGRYSYGDGTRSTTTERGSQESPGPGQPENRSGDDPDDSVSP